MNTIFQEFNNILSSLKLALTYQETFDALGISKLLDNMYINPLDLKKEYINIFMKAIEDVVKQPLFKDIDLSDKEDLTFLRDNLDFKEKLDDVVSEIQKDLVPYQVKVLDYFKELSGKSKIPLEDIQEEVKVNGMKIDKVSLLFILEDLKNRNEIYDYNGREVTLP